LRVRQFYATDLNGFDHVDESVATIGEVVGNHQLVIVLRHTQQVFTPGSLDARQDELVGHPLALGIGGSEVAGRPAAATIDAPFESHESRTGIAIIGRCLESQRGSQRQFRVCWFTAFIGLRFAPHRIAG